MATPGILIHRLLTNPDGSFQFTQHTLEQATWDTIIDVLSHVSLGQAYNAFAARYPDAAARRALGALEEAGLLQKPPLEPVQDAAP